MKRIFSIVGMLAGACFVVLGILAMCGVYGYASSHGGSAPYDSGYASFGGDYYTYSVNNTAETASAARACASNLVGISNMLQYSLGLFSIAFGIVVICAFGVVFAGCKSNVEDTDNVIIEVSENRDSIERGISSGVDIQETENTETI